MYPTTPITAAERADLHARARSQAQHLRHSAAAAFWQGVYRVASRALRAAHHGLLRLAHISHHPLGV